MNEYHIYFCQKKKATSQICYKKKNEIQERANKKQSSH
jgi:hypothetical protein